jgi:TetR/AcrR family transcriptional regulator, transcriptional repressor for nem operon
MSETKMRLLDAAAGLVQTQGYNGFSFHDLAAAIGIKTASIHYHFATKSDLGQALVLRYTDAFMAALGPPDAVPPDAALDRYIGLFRATLGQGRMCLCGMLGAETSALPRPVAEKAQAFFAANRLWLSAVLHRAGSDAPGTGAALFLATLEGALMIARATGDDTGFDTVARAARQQALAV